MNTENLVSLPTCISIITFSAYKQLRQSSSSYLLHKYRKRPQQYTTQYNLLILTLTSSNLFFFWRSVSQIGYLPQILQTGHTVTCFHCSQVIIDQHLYIKVTHKRTGVKILRVCFPHTDLSKAHLFDVASSLKRFQDGWQLTLGSEDLNNYANILLAYCPHRTGLCSFQLQGSCSSCRWGKLHHSTEFGATNLSAKQKYHNKISFIQNKAL